jgi:prephenate dehydrogenase
VVATGDRDGLLAALEHARRARVNLPPRIPAPAGFVELRVPVPDRPGVLADVTTLATDLGVNITDLEIAHSAEGTRGVLILLVAADQAERLRGELVRRGYRPSAHHLD